MSINSCCSWFVCCLVKIIGKVNTIKGYPYSQRYLVLGLVGLVGLGLPLL